MYIHMNDTHYACLWVTYEWVMSHIWVNLATNMNEWCHTYVLVMSHLWVRRVSFHIWVHIWVRRVLCMNKSRHTCKCATSRIRINLVMHMHASCHAYEQVMSHTTDRGDQTSNDCDSHIFKQLFAGVPVCLQAQVESPISHIRFHGSQRESPALKWLCRKMYDLEIQIFQVWSHPWVVWKGDM